MELLIKGGTVVTATESFPADVAVDGGKIVAIGKDLAVNAEKVVDATGKLVLPGALDAHTHMAMPFGGTVSADSYLAGTRAAVCGGVTTIFDYPVQHKGETILGLIGSKKDVLEKEACCDYAFHCCITDLNDGEILDEMEQAVEEGITSFKCFLVYKKEGMMVDDAMQSRRIYRNPLGTAVIYNEILNNRGTQFDPEIADVFLKLLDENRLVINADYKGIEDEYALPAVESEIEKFISNVMTTMRTQEDSEGFDFLTGLPMRNRGEKLAAQFMQQDDGYLVFLDMDNLKKINDIYGHKAGDRALKLLGSLLLEFAQHSVVCRLGGDEFLMFVPNVSKEKISEIVRSILQKFEEQKEEDMEIRHASISAGICETTKGASFEECYTKADKALYYVKQNGKGDFFFYQQMEQEQKTDQGTGRDLAMITKALRESGNYTGALDLDYREFAKIYEYMNHLGERYKYHCYLVMVTMDTTPDYVMYIENIERALESMEQAIRQTIRKVDICTRYSSMQYLIILFEADETKIPKVMDRIFTQYYKQYDKSNFIPKYEYILIMEEKEEQ